MSDLKLWGRATSSNVQKVLWMLGEIGVDCQRIDAGGEYGVVDTDAYAKLNPNRKVPVLEDGDLVLYESHTILRYLARKHRQLLPDDPLAAAIADQWMDWSATTLTPPLIGVFFQTVRLPVPRRDAAVLDAHAKVLRGVMRILDARLGEHAWLAGDEFTLADIAAGTLMYRYFKMDIEREDLANVARWYGQLKDRSFCREVVMTSYESLREK